jgi:hypothetical protein
MSEEEILRLVNSTLNGTLTGGGISLAEGM